MGKGDKVTGVSPEPESISPWGLLPAASGSERRVSRSCGSEVLGGRRRCFLV